MAHLAIRIDPEVFKLKDKKVQQLLSAKLPLELFAMMIQPADPYVLINDTIYALTEQEFYAMRSVYTVYDLSDREFEYVLSLQDTSFMSRQDMEELAAIKSSSESCSACKYRKYKDRVFGLVKKYNITIPDDIRNAPKELGGEYPETSEKVAPKVFGLVEHMYAVPLLERRSCMDCVEKHISQAYVLSRECSQGYPEHISYVIGHLGEAIDELPKEMDSLRLTLEFCLAKTNYEKRPFVPLGVLMGHVNLARMRQEGETDDNTQDSPQEFDLEITDDIVSELSALPHADANRVIAACEAIDKEITLGVQNLNRNIWLGSMACLSDSLVELAPLTANMIRHRRLVFSGAPDLMIESGYPMSDISDVIRSRRK